MIISMLLLTCAIGAESSRPLQPTVPQPVAAEFSKVKHSPPPASALDAIRRARQFDPVPVSALSALRADLPLVSPEVSQVTPEVAEILERWEAASREVRSLKFEIHRTVYSLVWQIEQRSEGELYFESPGKVSIELRPTKIQNGVMPARVGKRNSPFRLESGLAESWIWTTDELATANGDERTYERIRVAPPSRFSFMPSIFFEGSAEKLREAFNISLVTRRDDRVVLKAVPRTIALKQVFREWLLIADTKTWQFTAAKYFDITGNTEVVYKLENGVTNQPLPADCFDPTQKWPGYREFKLD